MQLGDSKQTSFLFTNLLAILQSAIFGGQQVALIVLDPEFRIQTTNRFAQSWLKRAEAEMIGRHCYELFHGRDSICADCPAEVTFRTGETAQAIHTGMDSEGNPTHAGIITQPIKDEQGRVLFTLEIVRDESAAFRRNQQNASMLEALTKSEQRYRTVFELASDAFLTVLPPPGGICDANESAMRILGYTKEELTEMRGMDIIAPEVFATAFQEWTRQVEERGFFLIRTLWVRKDGTRVPIEVSGKPFDLNGQVLFQLIGRDITERKQMEDELHRAQRLEMAGRVAGQVAHDFNNLLGPLVGFPGFIKEALPPGHPATDLCDTMLLAARQMADINADLLALGKRVHYENQPANLNQLVHEAVGQMSPLPETLVIEYDLSDDLMSVNASEPQMLRVLSNLLFNARDALHDKGSILIKTENISFEKPAGRYNRIGIGEYVRVQISDNGIGIPAEIMDKIFDPFFTTKREQRKRGSGLGLSIVQAIVNDHDGFIDVESSVREGTTFSVYFSACLQNSEAKTGEVYRGGQESILVVDDDEMQLEVAKHLLASLGYQVSTVRSGEGALDYLRDRPVDLLLLDMVMPGGIDGTETYRRALRLRPGQRAMILSGFADTERVRTAQALGVSCCLRKPVTLVRLAKGVREALDRKGGCD